VWRDRCPGPSVLGPRNARGCARLSSVVLGGRVHRSARLASLSGADHQAGVGSRRTHVCCCRPIVLDSGSSSWSLAAIAVGLATFFWGLDNNLTREVRRYSAAYIAQVKGLVAGSVNLVIGIAVAGQVPDVLPLVWRRSSRRGQLRPQPGSLCGALACSARPEPEPTSLPLR